LKLGVYAMWTCPKCASKVDPEFDVCWQCGTSPEGVEDPTFVSADDAGPIEAPPVAPTLESIHDAGEILPGGELVACYQALSLMEAQFLANELTDQGITAVSDQQDFQDSLGTWDGNPRVYCREEDLPRARAWVEAYDAKRKAQIGKHIEQ